MLSVRYGWGCEIHPALQNIAMEVLLSNLADFLSSSLTQRIVIPGDSDLLIDVPNRRLRITFDHEGYVFSDGSDYELETSVWMSSAFSALPLAENCRGAGLIDYKKKQNKSAMATPNQPPD
jgi:hypothetical protein